MQAFLINLARRPDRLRAMTKQLERLALPFKRIRAIDARQAADAVVDRRFAPSGPLGSLAKGDKCCTLSHLRAWEAFLASGEKYGLILEDDVVLDRDAAKLLRSDDWIPEGVGLIKLEQYVTAGKRILLSDPVSVTFDRTIARLQSKHTGAAAYIISRSTAELLLHDIARWTLPVDHMLFNPNNSPVIEAIKPYQMMPVIARQSQDIGGATDIEEWRVRLRGIGARSLRREIMHAYYELRLLPWQIASVLRRKAYLVQFGALTPAPQSTSSSSLSLDAAA